MMIDLIDRSEVLYKFAEILPEADSLEWYEQAKPEEVKDLVDELYSIVLNVNRIDAKPEKHGHWINHFDDLFPEESTIACSVCHEHSPADMPHDNFCPNCGARMEGENDA